MLKQSTIGVSIMALCMLGSMLCQADTRVVQSAQYRAKMSGLSVDMERKLVDLGNGLFRLEAVAKNFWGSIRESEEFIWDQNGNILPKVYRYKQSALGIKKRRTISYNWRKDIASIDYKGKSYSIPLKPNILGPMTYQLKLQLDLIGREKDLAYTFIQKNRLKNMTFKIDPSPLDQSAKKTSPHSLVKVTRVNEGDDKTTQIWFDKRKNYSLSYLSQKTNKDEYSLSLRSQHLTKDLLNTPYEVLLPMLTPTSPQTHVR